MIELLTDPHAWISLLTLTVMEIVLGIDNLIFIAVLVDRLPPEQRDNGRRIGIVLALGTRLILLTVLSWIIGLTEPLFTVLDHAVSLRDVILISGGLFLLTKATREIHESIEGDEEAGPEKGKHAAFGAVIVQIAVLDIIFSIDSVITAVGMVDDLLIMSTAVILAVVVMLLASGPVTGFVSRHPTVKMLAFSFLLLIGTTLIADGAGFHIPKGYLYAAMAFSVFVEFLNTLARGRRNRLKSV
ncbi:MAG: TerC family protein [Rhodospirillaceae bacterium]|jgi:predicted tellurium resistance membrane protein TerC|nr:TerC family protein [Rhodospirillaceae bacterium]MBT5243684.1 TerC family protein [Rhodospirillaceae bacterium]MBT5563781.1 TerC family protein [Rhodospirillaceae bacterium]MBT6241730.1 TerC family protein [Rhodospirillaceae bacterium]MBT7137303.1 TerC family protein [Rhodospirillaceae bacterium]